MIVRYLFRDLLKRFPEWDASSKLSFSIALILLLVLLWLGFTGPQSIQFPARIGAFGLLLALQLIILWGNRRSMSPYHQAQHHFRKGEYAAARDILEQIPESGRDSVDSLILLGNSYRHLGDFDSAELAVRRALELRPDYHYALFAAGKLHLVAGQFEAAHDLLDQALRQGAPELLAFDAGLACLLMDDRANAKKFFARYDAAAADEPEKSMFARLCLQMTGENHKPPARPHSQQMAYWRDEAEKHSETPYGHELSRLLEQLDSMI